MPKKIKNNEKSANHKLISFADHISQNSLNLRRQDLSDNDIPALLSFLLLHPEIKTLDLSLNNIGDQGVADFAERNQTIIQANFSGNNISDTGLAAFAYKNQVITEVNFSHNLISDEGITSYAAINQTCYASQFSHFKLH